MKHWLKCQNGSHLYNVRMQYTYKTDNSLKENPSLNFCILEDFQEQSCNLIKFLTDLSLIYYVVTVLHKLKYGSAAKLFTFSSTAHLAVWNNIMGQWRGKLRSITCRYAGQWVKHKDVKQANAPSVLIHVHVAASRLTLFAHGTHFTVARNVLSQVVFPHNIKQSASFGFKPK